MAFPSKTGILYSSNRPSALAASSDDSLPGKQFNIYLVDNWNKSDVKQISKLTDLKLGNARFSSQYNTSHFTFISDENGINNRYAGFFKTERAGLDTLVFIGDEMLRNPPQKDVDSLLKEWGKTDIDSVGFVSITNDSSYVFPLPNYQSSMLETCTALVIPLIVPITGASFHAGYTRLSLPPAGSCGMDELIAHLFWGKLGDALFFFACCLVQMILIIWLSWIIREEERQVTMPAS